MKRDPDGLPICPDCGSSLSHESAGDRDTETMGGHDVEYFSCDNGCGAFEVIGDDIYPSSS